MPRLRLFWLAVMIWALAWFLPWTSSALIRAALATALFILPGACVQQWMYARAPDDGLRHITVGFAASVGITSLLGIVAKTLHLNYTFVSAGLFLIGAISLFGITRQSPAPTPRPWNKIYFVIGIGLVAACLVIVTQLGLFYSYNRGVFVDDYSYAALTTKFRTTGALFVRRSCTAPATPARIAPVRHAAALVCRDRGSGRHRHARVFPRLPRDRSLSVHRRAARPGARAQTVVVGGGAGRGHPDRDHRPLLPQGRHHQPVPRISAR